MADSKTEQAPKDIIYVPIPDPGMNREDKIDFLALWSIIWKGKWFILSCTLIGTLYAVYTSLYVVPVTYRSDAVLQLTETGNNKLSNLSSLVGSLPISMGLSRNNKSANIINYLNSRTFKFRLIEENNLLQRFHKNIWDKKNQKWMVDDPDEVPTLLNCLEPLQNSFSFELDPKTSLITLSWVDEDPKFTSTILNDVIRQLSYYLENEYESDAKKERFFIEKQLRNAENELEHWEKQVPSQQLTLSKIQREKLTAQAIYTELRKQLELAKISEVKEVVRFKVLDEPYIPEKRFKPNRRQMCLFAMFVSGFFSLFMVLFFNFIKTVFSQRNTGKEGN
nr:Wzz/FepE/Etk N-terminal domain-containing protein [uncultured Desulfobacter sp.]